MEIEVTQADRDAAKSLLGRDDAGPSWWSIDSGNADNDRLVQAFARHRVTAFAAGRAAREREIVEWLRGQANIGDKKADDALNADNENAARAYLGAMQALNRAADAIERGGV